MGHFQPTPQNSCQARCVIMMPHPVSECVNVFVVILLSVPQIFLYDCTEVSPFSLLFFGGDITIQKDQDQDTIAVDKWIVFRSPARIAHLVKVKEAHASAMIKYSTDPTLTLLCSTEFKERAGFSSARENPKPGACGLAES